eukprot:Blabericola_migrator_1__2782@NODE_1796_length_3779_cov_80_525862_g1158_i0_p1_GENE_NODE_1796_length_3779_cov_80_525862_g1158_i0NODE_1796_length_3779_cov_80_525862_g1158_i0_p1_ORF_typecomplete_len1184_score182_94Pkinase/PF00069_25/3e74Pkinase_Tyr/PF07714_17/9_4e45Kinaselike/PF14531_6/1_3e16PH/PF00169_29/2_2e16Kdo/PF06293_14/2_7e12EFhand_7/PF13499_6/2_9e09EFhand_7/PF13499_6/5_4e03EFhand_1/PF00036_32/2_6EFhand_1/PF00036_32/3_4e05EFhand_8/PF13833_6/0_27EFhand_8/PF13833_6/0_00041Pkinase_fungal/PF17667
MAAPNGAPPSPRTPGIWPPPKPTGAAPKGQAARPVSSKTAPLPPESSSVAGSAVSGGGGVRLIQAIPGAAANVPSRRGLRSLANKLSRLLGESKHAPPAVDRTVAPPDTATVDANKEKSVALSSQTLAKFDADEIDVLRKIYKELNLRSPGEGIDKETFQEYFPLPGLWGERLFQEFDTKKRGSIDYQSLMNGLAKCCRGTKTEKMQVLFNMFDLDGDGHINREELTLLLSNVPRLEYYLPDRLGVSKVNSKVAPTPPEQSPPDAQSVNNNITAIGTPQEDVMMHDLFWVSRGHKSSSTSSSLSSREIWDRDDDLFTGEGTNCRPHQRHPANQETKGFCSTTSWRTSLSGTDSPRAPMDMRRNESGDGPTPAEDEEEKFLFGAGPSPMVAELLAKAQSEEMGPSSMVDLEALVDHILEDYDTLDSNSLSLGGFKSFLEHHPRFLRLFSDSLREEVWALQGHALHRARGGGPGGIMSFSPSITAGTNRPASVVSSRADLPMDINSTGGPHRSSLHKHAEDAMEMNNLERWIKIQQLFTSQCAPKQMLNSPPSTMPPIAVSKTPASKSASPANTEQGHDSSGSQDVSSLSEAKAGKPKLLLPSENAAYPRHSRYAGSREVLDFLEVSLGQYASDEDDELHLTARDTDVRGEFAGSEALADNRLPIWHENKSPLACPQCHAPLLVCPKCNRKYPTLRMKGQQLVIECSQCLNSKPREFSSCWVCLWPFSNAFDMINQHEVLLEGTLYKIGRQSKKWVERYFVLVDRLLYYYSKETDSVPKGFVFLEGCFVDPISGEALAEVRDEDGKEAPGVLQRRFGFCIVHAGGKFARRNLYASDEQTRDRWLVALRSALNQQPIDQLFQLEEIIGQGKFSLVYRAVEKSSNKTYAIKIINKNRMTQHEKELLRGEMSILRLLRHPHVIYLKSLVTTKDILHIVMELVPGGELFDAISQRAPLSEMVVNRLTSQLLKTLVYLHKAGIVHRDLKPENILLTDRDVEKADIKIADFGLSCLCGPNEKLFQPCGTLVYVAPEVLTLQGYSHPVDLWSLGVIVYLLLAGRLPFPIMRNSGMSVLTEREKFYTPKFDGAVWKNVSRSAQDFISRLLELKPEKRMTASESLNHIWIKNPSAVLKDVTPKPADNPLSARRDTVVVNNMGDESPTTAPAPQPSQEQSRLLVKTQSDDEAGGS